MDRGAWRVTVHGVTKNRAQLSAHMCIAPSHHSLLCSLQLTTLPIPCPRQTICFHPRKISPAQTFLLICRSDHATSWPQCLQCQMDPTRLTPCFPDPTSINQSLSPTESPGVKMIFQGLLCLPMQGRGFDPCSGN